MGARTAVYVAAAALSLATASIAGAAQARAPIPGTEGCVGCHSGPAEKSYALSKHGVIARLEAGRTRAGAPPRAPTCVTCHPSQARRPATPHHDNPRARERARAAATATCGDCHAPRYVAVQLDVAARSLAIGEMKRREAQALVESARGDADPTASARIETLYASLVATDLRSLRLGLGHQSPDDQWWLGQAALDGSLLRIKGALSEARRDAARSAAAAR